MKAVGVTTEGIPVVDGRALQAFKGTHGVPLDAVVDTVYSRGMRVDWLGYFLASKEEGQKPENTKAQIMEALAVHHNKEELQEISDKLDITIGICKCYNKQRTIL